MYFIRLFKLFFLLLLLNCNSSQQQSFKQLESALISWYYKYHPAIASEHNILEYNKQIEKYDLNSIEEYKADINRFMIELSQIDETKLNDNDLIKYLSVNQFLFEKYNYIITFNEFSYNPKYFLENLYNSIFFIIHNNNLNMEQKTESILSRLMLFPTSISNIQKNIINYSKYHIDESFNLIIAIERLLSNLPLYINAGENTLNQIDDNILNINQKIKKLKNHFKNIVNKEELDKDKMISNYLIYNKNIKFDLDYKNLINDIHNKMLNISLPIYKLNNDEPVWVDKEDTLNIIHSILKESIYSYPSRNEIIMSLDESLNRVNLFSKEILNLKYNINDNYEIIINNYVYLEPNMLYKFWNDKKNTYLFLNSDYYQNSVLKNFNKYQLDLYNISNYFPGKYSQILETKKQQNSIEDIFIDNYTNWGWGLLCEYIFVDKGYGSKDNDIYRLIHLKNVLDSILKNMVFSNYYIHGKSEVDIENEIHNLTIYNREEIRKILIGITQNPIELNFEIIGYLKLKEIYYEYGYNDIPHFYSILVDNGHLNPDFIKELKFPNE